MRFHLFLFLFFITTVTFGQIKVTESFDDVPLTEVLVVLENNYGIKIAFDPDLIAKTRVKKDFSNVPIEDVFREILTGTELSFDRVKSGYYSIRPSNVIWEMIGQVIDADKEVIPFAKIRIKGTYSGAYANENGQFSITYRSDAEPKLEITSLGFKKQIISASELKENPVISMSQDVLEFPEVTIEYLTDGISVSKDLSIISVKPQEIGAVPGTTEPDVFQLIQNIPGIHSAGSTVSEIQIRGGTADQNNIMWEGIPIYHPGHFFGMISSINPNIIDETVLHRGIYDPYYGGKASGLIQLESINYIPEKLEAGAGVNLMQGDAYIKARLTPKVGILLSGRRSYVDWWASPTYLRYSDRVYQETEFANTGTYIEEPEFSGEPAQQIAIENRFVFYDFNGKLIYQPGKNQLLTLSGLYTSNNLDYSSDFNSGLESISNLITSTNTGYSLNYKNQWSDRFRTSILGAYAQYTYDYNFRIREQYDTDPFEENLDKGNLVNHYVFKLNNELDLNEKHIFSFGYQLQSNRVEYSLVAQEEEDTASEFGSISGITNVINLNHTWDNDKFLTKIGTRLSHFTSTGQFYIEPRLYGQYKINKWLSVNIAAGIQNQFISQVDEFENAFFGQANRIWVMAEEDDPIVRSLQTNTGFFINHKGWSISVDAYYKNLSGIINFSENENISSGFSRGDGIVKGIDFLIRKRWKNLRSWISYSLSDVSYAFPDLASNSFSAPFNQRHSFKWVNTFDWRQFEFSATFKIASGLPYTPIDRIEEIPPEDPEEDPDYNVIYGAVNSKTLPVFHQLDMSIFYNFPKNPDKKWNGKIGISCFNVYNQNNFLSRTFDFDVEEIEDEIFLNTTTIDKFYLAFTPNILLRFDF